MAVKIISDSACDLPREIIEELDIDLLPIVVIKDEKEYLDQVDIMPLEVYEGMRKGLVYKTAQVPATMFEERFKKIVDSQDDHIYIAFSSGLSGTYQTSVIIGETLREDNPDLRLDIIDSRAASVGQGMIVMKAARMAKEGRTKEEIIDMVDFYSKHLEHIITVDNIDYLYRGGRVTRTEAFVGGLLNIKPIIDIDEDGRLQPIDKVRGHKKAIKKMLDIMEARGKEAGLKDQTIGILHTDDWDLVEDIKLKVEERFGSKEFFANNVGAAIGAHTGPGMAAIFFLNKSYS